MFHQRWTRPSHRGIISMGAFLPFWWRYKTETLVPEKIRNSSTVLINVYLYITRGIGTVRELRIFSGITERKVVLAALQLGQFFQLQFFFKMRNHLAQSQWKVREIS